MRTQTESPARRRSDSCVPSLFSLFWMRPGACRCRRGTAATVRITENRIRRTYNRVYKRQVLFALRHACLMPSRSMILLLIFR